MDDQQHSPEPWEWGGKENGIWITSIPFNDVAGGPFYDGVCITKEDAKRIVACINACQGISNENLKDGVTSNSLRKEILKWQRQED